MGKNRENWLVDTEGELVVDIEGELVGGYRRRTGW